MSYSPANVSYFGCQSGLSAKGFHDVFYIHEDTCIGGITIGHGLLISYVNFILNSQHLCSILTPF